MIWKRRAKKEDKSCRRLSLLEECFTAGRCEAAGYLAKLANEPATVPQPVDGGKALHQGSTPACYPGYSIYFSYYTHITYSCYSRYFTFSTTPGNLR